MLGLDPAASAAVIGAPGTGKTTTLIELVADRVERHGWSPDELLVLAPSRVSATRLRDAIALRLGVATNGPLARTVNSLAFELVGNAARLAGAEAPRLVTGGEQDSDLAQLVQGHIDEGTGPRWPDTLGPEVRRLRGFRTELRELMMRATEYDISPHELKQLGQRHERPEWAAAADFITEYLAVTGDSRPHQLDATEFARFAVAAIEAGTAGERVGRLRLVLVDDLQEATQSTLAILRALAGRGTAVVAFGDPDVAANAFRGGEPDALGRLAGAIGASGIHQFFLGTAHRQGPALRSLTARVTERVGAATVGQRRAVAGGADAAGPVAVVRAATPGREWAAVARALREHHLMREVPWSEMAVIVRSGDQVASVRRALALAEVPARSSVGATALRDDRAARALLTLVDVGSGRTPLTAELATELLLGPFGGLDRLALRRLRLALRAEELSGDGNRQGDELLVEGLSAPGRFVTIDHRVGRNAERLAETLAKLRDAADADSTIEELLWLAWERSGLAPQWFDQALSAGIMAAEANHNLDGIVALFTAASRFVERQPGTAASVFLDAVLDAEVPEDTLSPQPADDAVLVTTPSGTVGLEFDVVVIAALQDGAWPNLRLRGSLLGAQELVRVVTGMESATLDERKLVLHDELRMFALAVSRARRQVILAAVANEDEAPSVFLSLAPEGAVELDASTARPLSLRGMTGRLRRELVRSGDTAAASALARLAAEAVPGAHPAEWHGLLEPSSTEPLFDEEDRVPVSPSKLESFEESPVDWFIDHIAGSEPSNAMAVGTIVHWAMETAEDDSVDAVWSRIEERWHELLFESPWMAEYQRTATRKLAAGVAEYLGDFRREGKQLIGAERRFTLEIDRADVRGSIDRVERSDDGSVVIVDLKTGSPITKQAELDEHPQLGVYQLAYAQGVLDEYLDELGSHQSGGAKLLFVKEGVRGKLYREGVQAPLSAEALEGFRTRIRQAAIGMAAAQFTSPIELAGWGRTGSALHRVRAVSSD